MHEDDLWKLKAETGAVSPELRRAYESLMVARFEAEDARAAKRLEVRRSERLRQERNAAVAVAVLAWFVVVLEAAGWLS